MIGLQHAACTSFGQLLRCWGCQVLKNAAKHDLQLLESNDTSSATEPKTMQTLELWTPPCKWYVKATTLPCAPAGNSQSRNLGLQDQNVMTRPDKFVRVMSPRIRQQDFTMFRLDHTRPIPSLCARSWVDIGYLWISGLIKTNEAKFLENPCSDSQKSVNLSLATWHCGKELLCLDVFIL